MIPQNLFSAGRKAPQKMAHPVPSYMVVTPPRPEFGPGYPNFFLKCLKQNQRM